MGLFTGRKLSLSSKFYPQSLISPYKKAKLNEIKGWVPLAARKKKKRYNNRGLIKDVRAVPDESFALASHSFFASIPSSGEYRFFRPLRALG